MAHVSVQTVKDDHGISFTCCKPESIHAYNQSIMNFLNLTDWTGDGNGSLSEALKHDKYFFMGYIYIGTNLVRSMDLTDKNDKRIEQIIAECCNIQSTTKQLQQNEILYLKALQYLFKGQIKKALEAWKCIVELNSFDILALLYLHYVYMGGLGNTGGVLKSISCVVGDFERAKPNTLPYIYGLYGMALEENYDYVRAWKYIHLSLKANPFIVTSSHAKVHVLQELGHNVATIQFLSDTEKHWRNNVKMHHVEWHWMISNIDIGKYRKALDLFDASYLNKNNNSIKDTVRLRDAASFLWRLELNEYDFNDLEMMNDIKYRWNLCRKYIKQELNGRYIQIYHDSYYLMNLIKNNEHKLAQEYIVGFKKESMEHIKAKSDNTYLVETAQNGAIEIFDGLYNGYIVKDYDKAFNSMYNMLIVNDNKWRMAGSRAQKEIFPITMIDLAFKASKYHKLKCLLNERLESKQIFCCNTLNLLSRLYRENYNDYGTSNIYQNMRMKVINDQYDSLHDKSMDEFSTFSIDYASKL